MPKPFSILLQVEEIAVGPVMAVLNRTPGVIKFDVLLDKDAVAKKKPNGHATSSEPNGTDNGDTILMDLIAKGPITAKEGIEAFDKLGRAKSSLYTAANRLKRNGLLGGDGIKGYKLTAKGRRVHAERG